MGGLSAEREVSLNTGEGVLAALRENHWEAVAIDWKTGTNLAQMLEAEKVQIVWNALHGTYHALSSRHLPRYLAEFCYRFNHRFQLDKMVDRLLQASLHTQPVPQRLLKLAEVRW